MTCSVPVVFIIFRRPDTTARVFEAIRQAQPSKLFVIADGPRSDEEALACENARHITEDIDWECEVFRDYSESNLGCKKRVVSGLDWVFSQVEDAIILEDDCLPSQTFFTYCQILLRHYQCDTRIMMISGTNLLKTWKDKEKSYILSHYGSVWGWATWRRAWKEYDENIKLWGNPQVRQDISDIFLDQEIFWERAERFDSVYNQEIDTWDYQWTFTRLINMGLAITPGVNLISNIGFGKDATHTADFESPYSNLPFQDIVFPLIHPPTFIPDSTYVSTVLRRTTIFKRSRQSVNKKIKKMISKIIKIINRKQA